MDGRQQELVRDNFELKDLCLYLDEERNNPAAAVGGDSVEIEGGEGDATNLAGNPDEESCIGDKLSCPQCGYGPIWIVGGTASKEDEEEGGQIGSNKVCLQRVQPPSTEDEDGSTESGGNNKFG